MNYPEFHSHHGLPNGDLGELGLLLVTECSSSGSPLRSADPTHWSAGRIPVWRGVGFADTAVIASYTAQLPSLCKF